MKYITYALSLFLMIFSISNLAFANPYTPNSQAWHDWNAIANSEAERMRQQQRQNQGYAAPREPVYTNWSVFVYNDETGSYNYIITHATTKGSGSVIDLAKKQLEREGLKANKSLKWKGLGGAFTVVVMGKNAKTGKWEADFDNYIDRWESEYKRGRADDDVLGYSDRVEKRLLEKCQAKANYCQTVFTFRNIK